MCCCGGASRDGLRDDLDGCNESRGEAEKNGMMKEDGRKEKRLKGVWRLSLVEFKIVSARVRRDERERWPV